MKTRTGRVEERAWKISLKCKRDKDDAHKKTAPVVVARSREVES